MYVESKNVDGAPDVNIKLVPASEKQFTIFAFVLSSRNLQFFNPHFLKTSYALTQPCKCEAGERCCRKLTATIIGKNLEMAILLTRTVSLKELSLLSPTN